MKKLILLVLSLCCVVATFAQYSTFNLQAKVLRDVGRIPADTIVTFTEFAEFAYAPYEEAALMIRTDYRSDSWIEITKSSWDAFDFIVDTPQNLWDKNVILKVLPSIVKYGKGFQLDIRYEQELDAIKYVQMIKNNGLQLEDPYLESYVYSVVAKIAPQYLLDGRPSNVNIIIQQNPSLNASCFPNGTIVINSGLLAALHTEDELAAILSHEIAHFVLDHAMQNINAEIKRQERAAFWAGVATIATAVAEGVVAANSDYYIPGAATYAVAALSTSLASDVCKQLGMEYNHKQEREADALAIEVLGLLGYNTDALATALNRLKEYSIAERDNSIYLNSYSHPDLMTRIQDCGVPQEVHDLKYEQLVSFAITNAAKMKYDNMRFRQCLPLVQQNINNCVATADDYILKANCLLALENTEQTNLEILKTINLAKELEPTNINIYKSEIIATLRLEQYEQTVTLLSEYIAMLVEVGNELPSIHSDSMWQGLRMFISNESQWAKNMLVKVKGMQSYMINLSLE